MATAREKRRLLSCGRAGYDARRKFSSKAAPAPAKSACYRRVFFSRSRAAFGKVKFAIKGYFALQKCPAFGLQYLWRCDGPKPPAFWRRFLYGIPDEPKLISPAGRKGGSRPRALRRMQRAKGKRLLHGFWLWPRSRRFCFGREKQNEPRRRRRPVKESGLRPPARQPAVRFRKWVRPFHSSQPQIC